MRTARSPKRLSGATIPARPKGEPLTSKFVVTATLTALAALSAATAAVAKPTLAQQELKILETEYAAQVHYKPAQVSANIATTEHKLTSCAQTLESLVDGGASVHSPQVIDGDILIDELDTEFTADIATVFETPNVKALKQLAKLSLSRQLHRDAVNDLKYAEGAMSLNTCADLTKWEDSNWKKEPSATKTYARTTNWDENIPFNGPFTSQSASSKYAKLAEDAGKAVGALLTKLGDDFSSWGSGYNI
jgi:hypothetical protein